MIVMKYEHIDFLEALIDPITVYESWWYFDSTKEDMEKDIAEVKKQFIENGWEGDGKIKMIWLPPFISTDDTVGSFVWFVKQGNNGTAFLGFEEMPKFSDAFQNDFFDSYKIEQEKVSCITDGLTEYTLRIINDVEKLMYDYESSAQALSPELQIEIVQGLQGKIVSMINHYISTLFYQILHHVIEDKNILKLKLSSFKADVKLKETTSDENHHDFIYNLSNGINESFAFLPYDKRMSIVQNGVGLSSCEVFKIIKTHVELRNAIQHHNSFLQQKTLENLGVKEIILSDESGKQVKFTERAMINLPIWSVKQLIDAFRQVVQMFDEKAIDLKNSYDKLQNEPF